MKSFRVCYFSATSTELPSLSRGINLLRDAGEEISVTCRTQTQLFDKARVSAFVTEALRSDAVILTLHGGKASCPAFDLLLEEIGERRAAKEPSPTLHIQPVGGDEEAFLAARLHSDGMDDGRWQDLFPYFAHGGPVNIAAGLAFLRAVLSGTGEAVAAPVPVAHEGLYHPDLGYLAHVETYEQERIDPSRPTVGLWFFQSLWVNGNLDHIDSLIREIEKRGANVIPVFSMRLKDASMGCRGADEIVESYFMKDGNPRIHVLISAMSMSMTLTNREFRTVLPRLNVAVLQAMTSSLPYAVWKESPHGMSMMDVTYQAAQPEFDGNLICVPVATREEDRVDPVTGGLLMRLSPIADRVSSMVSLALKWAALRHTPNAHKRIAIVFHHYPPRNDRVGCAAGLDSFASVKHLLDRMSEKGYRIDHPYRDGDELAGCLLRGMTCDRRWLPADQMAERAEASAERSRFLPWHRALPQSVREKMITDWGDVPGDLFVHKDILYFAGVRNGNVFLTIQPPRGHLENPQAVYHDPHLSPPHHYLAHYRWIRDVFQADAAVHVGKHGSLEWLPGKALGLSEECYPDLSILDLPNVYPYIINDPSEGTKAKRRSYCCIIDHLTPAATNADLYEDLTNVERALADCAEAARHDPGKLPTLTAQLWDAVESAGLHHDLGITREEVLGDRDRFVTNLHTYLSEIADTMICDGLHVLGQTPEKERLTEFLAQLTRLPNGDIPSLREEILSTMGFCYDELLERRGESLPGWGRKTGGQLIAQAHDRARELMGTLAEAGFRPPSVPQLVRALFGETSPRIDVVPRISGFFRDAFPNLVELLDRAVRMVAVLGEPAGSNFIRGHVLADMDAYRREGKSEGEAWRLAQDIARAMAAYPFITLPRERLFEIASICIDTGIDGHRGDIIMLKTAKTVAAFRGRTEVTSGDVEEAARFVLPHRIRRQPLQDVVESFQSLREGR